MPWSPSIALRENPSTRRAGLRRLVLVAAAPIGLVAAGLGPAAAAYVLEWAARSLKVSIDGTTCVEHVINPLAPLIGSAPFDRPFNLNLTQMLGSAANVLPSGATVDDVAMTVDYVRVWS